MKFNIKAKDILPYMETKSSKLIENYDKIYEVVWSRYAPNIIGIDGFYTRFMTNGENKEELLKLMDVNNYGSM